LKAKVESRISQFSFKCLVPGGFNMGFLLKGEPAPPYLSVRLALPVLDPLGVHRAVAAQVEFESKV
jgi:hypothetical protein